MNQNLSGLLFFTTLLSLQTSLSLESLDELPTLRLAQKIISAESFNAQVIGVLATQLIKNPETQAPVTSLFETTEVINGKETVTAIANEPVRDLLWDALINQLPATRTRFTLKNHKIAKANPYNRAGSQFITFKDTQVHIHDENTGIIDETISVDNLVISSHFIGDEDQIVIQEGGTYVDHSLKILDRKTKETLQRYDNKRLPMSTEFSRNGLRAAMLYIPDFRFFGKSPTISTVWDCKTGKSICELDDPSVVSLRLNDEGTQALTISDHKTLTLWDVSSCNPTKKLTLEIEQVGDLVPWDAFFSDDQSQIVCVDFAYAHFLDGKTGQHLYKIEHFDEAKNVGYQIGLNSTQRLMSLYLITTSRKYGKSFLTMHDTKGNLAYILDSEKDIFRSFAHPVLPTIIFDHKVALASLEKTTDIEVLDLPVVYDCKTTPLTRLFTTNKTVTHSTV